MKEGNNLFFGFLYAVYVTWSAYIGVPEETTSIVQIVATFNTIFHIKIRSLTKIRSSKKKVESSCMQASFDMMEKLKV